MLYEMHVGTFTPAGTWEAALGELPALAELGVTVLEIMPIADFSVVLAGAMTASICLLPHVSTARLTTAVALLIERILWGWA